MPIYPIIPKTAASKGKAKEPPVTMPTTRTTRARAAAASQDTPDANAKSSKIPQTTRKTSGSKNKEETQTTSRSVSKGITRHDLEAHQINQTPMMKRIASFNIMNKTNRPANSATAVSSEDGKETMQVCEPLAVRV